MNYRLDSDITYEYGNVFDVESGYKIAPGIDIKWREPTVNYSNEDFMEVIKQKTGGALWLVSQCNRTSRRSELVEKLKKYINIDIYGKCGKNTLLADDINNYRLFQEVKCSPQNFLLFLIPGNATPSQGVDLQTYKFYLAFENSLCIDYLTEKSFKVMNDLIIPVIYSGVEISRFLPPNSYIDANQFETVEDLGEFLTWLADSPDEYVKYFWWKKYYRVELASFDVCKICKKLNEPNLQKKKSIYHNINEWFNDNVCMEPRIKF
jgi:alpha-1,3-fucosyltransferase